MGGAGGNDITCPPGLGGGGGGTCGPGNGWTLYAGGGGGGGPLSTNLGSIGSDLT